MLLFLTKVGMKLGVDKETIGTSGFGLKRGNYKFKVD